MVVQNKIWNRWVLDLAQSVHVDMMFELSSLCTLSKQECVSIVPSGDGLLGLVVEQVDVDTWFGNVNTTSSCNVTCDGYDLWLYMKKNEIILRNAKSISWVIEYLSVLQTNWRSEEVLSMVSDQRSQMACLLQVEDTYNMDHLTWWVHSAIIWKPITTSLSTFDSWFTSLLVYTLLC